MSSDSRPPPDGEPEGGARGPVPRLPPGVARLPDGWRHFRDVHLPTDIDVRVRTLRYVPHCIRD
eukprot:8607848-Pyramimonas_sp.AAC.1